METKTFKDDRQGTQTRYRGNNWDEYQIYLTCANDGQGGDVTNNYAPLKTFEEWFNS